MNYIQKYIAALKLNRWPMIDYVQQAEQEQQEKVNRLYPKKWHNFVWPIYEVRWSQIPPWHFVIIQRSSLIESDDSLESQSNKVVHMCLRVRLVKYGLPFTLIPQHGRIMRLQWVTICWHLSCISIISVLVLDSQSCATQIRCVVLLKSQHSLSLDCYNRYIDR